MTCGIYGLPSPTLVTTRSTPISRLWLMTIVDLMLVMLAFFVLMFSMSRVEVRHFAEVAKSYGQSFGVPVNAQAPTSRDKLPKIPAGPADDLDYLNAVLKAPFANSATLKDIEFHTTAQYLVLSLPVTAMFEADSGALRDGAKGPVFDLAGVLSNLKNRVAVVGTAAVVQNDADAVAAWSLAVSRARTMAEALKAGGYTQTVSVFGRGGAATDVAAAIGQVDILIMPEGPAR